MAESPKIITMGEAIIDLIASQPVSLEETSTFQKCFGGSPLNTAIGVARLGCSVGSIAAVGEDQFGSFIVDTLKDNRVDTQYIINKKGLRTTLAFVSNDPRAGERSFSFYRKPWSLTADSTLEYGDLSSDYIHSARILHISGFALSQEPSRSTIIRIAQEAKAAGVTLSFDPTLRLDIWNNLDEMHSVYSKVMKLIDVASFSEEESAEILGTRDPKEAADIAFGYDINLIGLKKGKNGSVIASSEGSYIETKAFEVKPVDTTGAGDAWDAAILVGLVEDWPLEASAVLANAVGALVVTAKGAITAMPTRDQLRSFLSEKGLLARIREMGVIV